MTIPFLDILYRAVSSPYGLAVRVSDNVKAKQALYRARIRSGDPTLKSLSIRSSPNDPHEELWIVRQEKENEN